MYVYKFVYTLAGLLLISRVKNVEGGNKSSIYEVRKILFKNEDILKNISVPHMDFDTGEQEFGCFKGYFKNLNIYELDAHKVTDFKFSVKQLEVNISVPRLNFTGDYDLDGMLNFPMGNKPIHVFGKGDMKIVIGNLTTSVKLTLKTKAGIVQVHELLISINITSMNAKLSNLMGGGALENIFNEYLGVLGPTVFDYYKNDITEQLKQPLIHEINEFLKTFFES